MPDWIAVSKIGNYPQGDITSAMFEEMVSSYNKDFQAAPFINAHRKFDESGVMIENPSAYGWVDKVMTDGTFLYVMVEDENRLDWYYDGHSYRYASIEIEVIKLDTGKESLYLGAVAITNFPAAKIPAIVPIKQFNRETQKTGMMIYGNYTFMNIKQNEDAMSKEQLIQLCKVLGIPEESKPETVIAKLTEIKTKFDGSEEMKQYSSLIETVSKLVTPETPPPAENQNDPIVLLTNKVDELYKAFNKQSSTSLESEIDKAIADEIFLPAQKEHLMKSYANNAEGFKAFAAASPKLTINSPVIVPKDEGGKPITFKDLLDDTAQYQKVMEENPALFNQLRTEYYSQPRKKEEK